MHHIQARSQPPVSRVMKPAAPWRTASFPADRFTKTQLHQPLPAMSRHHPATIPPPLIHKPWAARAGQPWRKTVASLVAASLATPMAVVTASLAGVAVGSLTPPAQAHVSRCVTLKGVSSATLEQVMESGDRLGWECLRIVGNHSLTTLDLSALTSLTFLKIEGNDALTNIKLPTPSNLQHLYINSNNNSQLESIDLSRQTRLTHLQIKNNKCLLKIMFPSQSNLQYIYIGDNGLLERINLDGLTWLRCLHIKNNHALQSISAANITDSRCIFISGNEALDSVDLSSLTNVINLKIEGSNNLTTILLPPASRNAAEGVSEIPRMNSS